MKNDIKKIIATAIATGGIVAGGFLASDTTNCDYTVEYNGQQICFTSEEKQAIESGLKPNTGFGGVQFGQK